MSEQEKTENRKKKIGEIFRDNLQKIMIIALSVLYVAQGVFKFQKKQASIYEILGNIGLSLVVGIIISGNLVKMGLNDGRKADLFISSQKRYGETKEKATEYFDKLPVWCEYKNDKTLELKKKDIITSAGLKWRGYRIGYYHSKLDELSEEHRKAIEKADNCKINKINMEELLSDLPVSKKNYGSRFGKSERQYQTETGAMDLISRFGTACIGGLYTLAPLLTKDNYQEVLANVMWNLIQIVMWLAFGSMKYANAKSFMVDEYRQTHIIQKTELLNEFMVTVKNNPKLLEEYEYDEEIEQFEQEISKVKEEEVNAKE